MTTAQVRPVRPDDAPAVAAVYAPYVRDTVISFETEAPDEAEMARRIAATTAAFPWLVVDVDGAVAGYAYAGLHSSRDAYRWSTDVSVYLHRGAHRRGLGRQLYGTLFALLRAQGYVNAYAGITLPNAASVGLHEAVGFRPVGVYDRVGFKAGQWHDVGWWQLALLERPAVPAEPVPWPALPAGQIAGVLGGNGA